MTTMLTKTFAGWDVLRAAILPLEDWLTANLGAHTNFNYEPYYRKSFTCDIEDYILWTTIERRVLLEYNIQPGMGIDTVHEILGPGWHMWIFEEFDLGKYMDGTLRYMDRHCRWCLFIDDEYKALECKLAVL
jgi:hypothetical protein